MRPICAGYGDGIAVSDGAGLSATAIVGTPTTIAEAQHDVLLRPGAIDLLGQEIARGAACSSDFALVDHIALAPLPLEEVRARYGVRPPVDPGDGHHFAW